jgi:hypothetical protein
MLHVKPAALKLPERGDTDHALDYEGNDCTGHASHEDLLRKRKAAGMHRAKQIAAAQDGQGRGAELRKHEFFPAEPSQAGQAKQKSS